MQNDFSLERPLKNFIVWIPALLGIFIMVAVMSAAIPSIMGGVMCAAIGIGISWIVYYTEVQELWTRIQARAPEIFHARKPLRVRTGRWSLLLDRSKLSFYSGRETQEINWVSLKAIYVKREKKRPIEHLWSSRTDHMRTVLLITNHEQDMKLRGRQFDLDDFYVFRDELADLSFECIVLNVDFGSNAERIKNLAMKWKELEAAAADAEAIAKLERVRQEGAKEKLMSDRIARSEAEGVVDG